MEEPSVVSAITVGGLARQARKERRVAQWGHQCGRVELCEDGRTAWGGGGCAKEVGWYIADEDAFWRRFGRW